MLEGSMVVQWLKIRMIIKPWITVRVIGYSVYFQSFKWSKIQSLGFYFVCLKSFGNYLKIKYNEIWRCLYLSNHLQDLPMSYHVSGHGAFQVGQSLMLTPLIHFVSLLPLAVLHFTSGNLECQHGPCVGSEWILQNKPQTERMTCPSRQISKVGTYWL